MSGSSPRMGARVARCGSTRRRLASWYALPLVWLIGIYALAAPSSLRAALIDEIVVTRVGKVAEIEVRFSRRVRYLRHFPLDKGDMLRVDIGLLPLDGDIPLAVLERRRVPRNELLEAFEVMLSEQGSVLEVKFAAPVSFRVGPGSDGRSIRIRVPVRPADKAVPKPVPEKGATGLEKPASGIALGTPGELVPVPPTRAPPDQGVPPSDVDAEAASLMAQSRTAMDIGDYATAVDTLNRLLNLPPNRFSREAQELAGVARQVNGEVAKARAEYELYLKLYPEGEGAVRVRNRLAGLVAGGEEERKEVVTTEVRGTEKMLYGSFSQYYYNGATKIDTTTKSLQLPTSEQLSFTDQSALISSFDLTGRVRRDTSDTRIVIRDTYSADLLEDGNDRNRLYAAYVEHEQKDWGLMLRAGRQSPPTGGVVERFDGGYIRKTLGRQFRIFGIAGEPKDYKIDSTRRFYQGGVEIGRDGGVWGLTLYGFDQTIDDISDRRTVGGEARYFSNGSSIYSLLDYDLLYDDLNILLTQANWQNARGTGMNVIFDRRKTPSLQTANALIGEPTTSIQQLLDSGLSAEMLRDRAAAVTADSTLLLVGLTQTVNGNWQVGGDVRAIRVSATEGSGVLPPAPATGTIYTYTLQTTATAIFGATDVNVLSIGLIDAPTYSGPLVLLSNSTNWRNWRFEPSLRYYQQNDDVDTTLSRLNGGLRLSYRVRNRVSLEAEAGYEVTRTDSVFADDKVQREYFSIGYRWDFY